MSIPKDAVESFWRTNAISRTDIHFGTKMHPLDHLVNVVEYVANVADHCIAKQEQPRSRSVESFLTDLAVDGDVAKSTRKDIPVVLLLRVLPKPAHQRVQHRQQAGAELTS